jgi:hypothetical protein
MRRRQELHNIKLDSLYLQPPHSESYRTNSKMTKSHVFRDSDDSLLDVWQASKLAGHAYWTVELAPLVCVSAFFYPIMHVEPQQNTVHLRNIHIKILNQ